MPKGNRQATGKKAAKAPEMASRARSVIIKALDILEASDEPLPVLLAREAKENPIKIMELISKYLPKEFHGTIDHAGTIEHVALSETDRIIEGIVEQSADGAVQKPVPH